MDALRVILDSRVVVIYRGLSADACVLASRALYSAGLRAFEVTANSDRPAASIAAVRAALPADATVGAGTVLAAAEVAEVAAAGAEFVISPHTDPAVIAATRDAGLVSVPGAQTATEVLTAWRAGGQLVKVFPVSALGAEYVRQLRGPLPQVPLLASGGVHAELGAECLRAGCRALGVGLPLFGLDPGAPLDPAAVRAAGVAFLDTIRRPA